MADRINDSTNAGCVIEEWFCIQKFSTAMVISNFLTWKKTIGSVCLCLRNNHFARYISFDAVFNIFFNTTVFQSH